MDLNEFSVACKLINLKLKGMEMPKTLPPQLISSGQQAAAAMNMGGMGGMMPPNSLPIQGGMGMPGECQVLKYSDLITSGLESWTKYCYVTLAHLASVGLQCQVL